MMLIDFEPGDYVTNPANKDWGLGRFSQLLAIKLQLILKTLENE